MNDDLFRAEVLRRTDEPDLGNVLRLAPWWLPWSFWLLLGAGVAASLVFALSTVSVYESGIAVMRMDVVGTEGCSIERADLARPDTTLLVPENTPGATYVAVLPGNSRPRLVRGMPVALRVTGYPDAVLTGTLESMGDRLLAPSEARSFLESFGADPRTVTGPFVPICGRLETDRFQSGGDEYRLHDGMLAVARVKLREERPFERLVPRPR